MSGYLSRLPLIGSFNHASGAGPRRLLMIAGGGALVAAAVFGVASIQHKELPVSNSGRLPRVDPTPGGVNSNAQQDKLHLVSNQLQAERAQKAGQSFTPVMAAGQRYTAPKAVEPELAAPPVQASAPVQPIVASPAVTPVVTAPKVEPLAVAPSTTTVSAPTMGATRIATGPTSTTAPVQPPVRTPKDETDFKAALDKLLAGGGGRSPRTDVMLPPDDAAAAEGSQASAAPMPSRRRTSGSDDRQSADVPVTTPVSSSSAFNRQNVLIPAGRGIYAHTILAANSDAQSPVVLQADSGPISGDRMIGTFSRERDRLVIRISKVIHNGQEIGTDGVVVAPGSMEVGVASSVDQNYLSRFALPAAAAFVQGLGQAIAQSNSTSVVGPLGSVGVQNRLDFNQQLGIGAGVAAAQVGSALQQSAPRGPTVILDVGSSVGVMFLTNVTANP